MNTIIIVAFVILLLIIAVFPNRKENFEMDVELNNMSCLEYMYKHPTKFKNVLRNINGQFDRQVTVADMDRVVIPTYTPQGIMYNEETRCVIRHDRLDNYKINDSCVFVGQTPGKLQRNYNLQHTDPSNQPNGCIIDPKDPLFTDFIDDAFYIKNKVRIDEIDRLNREVSTLTAEKKALSDANKDLTKNMATCEGNNKVLNDDLTAQKTKYDTCISAQKVIVAPPPPPPVTENPDGRCGANLPPCNPGRCCSQYGWCGSGAAYCDPPSPPPRPVTEDPDGRCGDGFPPCNLGRCCLNGKCGGGPKFCGLAQLTKQASQAPQPQKAPPPQPQPELIRRLNQEASLGLSGAFGGLMSQYGITGMTATAIGKW